MFGLFNKKTNRSDEYQKEISKDHFDVLTLSDEKILKKMKVMTLDELRERYSNGKDIHTILNTFAEPFFTLLSLIQDPDTSITTESNDDPDNQPDTRRRKKTYRMKSSKGVEFLVYTEFNMKYSHSLKCEITILPENISCRLTHCETRYIRDAISIRKGNEEMEEEKENREAVTNILNSHRLP